MNRTKQYQRFQTEKHIRRKEHIIRDVYCERDNCWTNNGKQRHRLDKGKIHCSCPMCAMKIKNLGFKHSDKKKLLSLNEQL